jgi:hypothetical protein
MDELLKILFGREPSGMGAFPIPQNPVTVEEIIPGQMPSVTNVTPSVTPAEQSRFRMPDFSGIDLPEMPNLRMPDMSNLRMPDLSGLRMPEFNLPMPGVPEYLQGLIANPEEAQKRAQQAGLMNAAMALLESSGPSPQRTSLGQAIGRGAGAYQQGAQGSFDQILQGMLVKSKLKPEAEKLTGEYANLAQLIYGTSDPAKLPAGAVNKIISQVNQSKSASAIKIMNEGQPGFDNTLKLKSAFAGEPVYKGFQEMKSAHNQITESLKSKSPAGDLAAATKFMKLLDPGSVVRESELYMAMQASGALDRFANYAENLAKGTKLTPTQRQDFGQLADKLYKASVDSFNQKRQEYADIAEENKLNATLAVGKPVTFGKKITVPY